jgi:hypothetical protein
LSFRSVIIPTLSRFSTRVPGTRVGGSVSGSSSEILLPGAILHFDGRSSSSSTCQAVSWDMAAPFVPAPRLVLFRSLASAILMCKNSALADEIRWLCPEIHICPCERVRGASWRAAIGTFAFGSEGSSAQAHQGPDKHFYPTSSTFH